MKIIDINDSSCTAEVLSVLERGGIIIVPTDTVYGLIADATHEEVLQKIYSIKKRPEDKKISLFVCDSVMLQEYTQLDQKLLDTLFTYWPGALTAVLKSNHTLRVFGDTIGVRIPNHTFLLKLLKQYGKPFVQTSANISGHGSFTKIADIIKEFKETDGVDLIVDGGDLPDNISSTVVDFTKDSLCVLRQGGVQFNERQAD